MDVTLQDMTFLRWLPVSCHSSWFLPDPGTTPFIQSLVSLHCFQLIKPLPQLSSSLLVLTNPSFTVFLTMSFPANLSPTLTGSHLQSQSHFIRRKFASRSSLSFLLPCTDPKAGLSHPCPKFSSFLISAPDNIYFLSDLSHICTASRGDHKENMQSTSMPWGDA